MASVITIRPNGDWTLDEITDSPDRFLREVYALIGDGCDFVQALSCGDGMYLLCDEEAMMRNPMPPVNEPLRVILSYLGCRSVRIRGAAVFVGETADQGDLAGLSAEQVATISAAAG